MTCYLLYQKKKLIMLIMKTIALMYQGQYMIHVVRINAENPQENALRCLFTEVKLLDRDDKWMGD